MTVPAVATVGPIFLTGHDPDFHAQIDSGAVILLRAGLSFVTGWTYNGATSSAKFLRVEADEASLSGHLHGQDALAGAPGLTLGVDLDRANGASLSTIKLQHHRYRFEFRGPASAC